MPINKDGKIFLTYDDLKPIFDGGGIVNGSVGGLLLGNYHSDGGIKVIREIESKIYEVIAELEGWEYIICPQAAHFHEEYITTINDEFNGDSEGFIEYDIPEHISIIDTRPMFENYKETNKILIFNEHRHYIVNKNSTKKYLKELNDLNNKYSR